MRMSDLVAQYIMQMLDEQNGSAEIQRNELAGNLGCVPSQINYVIIGAWCCYIYRGVDYISATLVCPFLTFDSIIVLRSDKVKVNKSQIL